MFLSRRELVSNLFGSGLATLLIEQTSFDSIALAAIAAKGSQLAGVVTRDDLSLTMAALSLQEFSKAPELEGDQIIVNRADLLQPFHGVGAALTASACYMLAANLTSAQRTAFLKECFQTNGFSMVRICIGDSDYTPNATFRTYDDVAGDASLTHFSIAEDVRYVIPVLQEVLGLNPGLKIIAAPWSPPAYMKTNGALIGADASFEATPAHMATYAHYFVKFIQAYAAYGIPIWAVTVQNEPNVSPPEYPGCKWRAAEITTFIGDYLGPAFKSAGITTRILTGDASWGDSGELVTQPLANSSANPYIFGAAYHGYDGTTLKQRQDLHAYPSKLSFMTEICVDNTTTVASETKTLAARDCISTIWQGASGILMWNLCTNPSGGPSPSTSCRGVVYIETDGSHAITRNAGFYMLSHIGRFVKTGAHRCASWSCTAQAPGTEVQSVAFVNPDGAVTLFLFNPAPSTKKVTITDAATKLRSTTTLAAGDMQTLIWSA